jgi:hypothetical protein
MAVKSTDRTARIRDLNDRFRTTLSACYGHVLVTAGVDALPVALKARLIDKVRGFNEFGPDNDPHREHDFGAIEIDGERYFWKVDYYDPSMEGGSEDPADPAKTTRVLTIMCAADY